MQFLNRELVRDSLDGCYLNSVGIECLAGAQHTPGNSGEFIGERGGELVAMHPRCRIGEPRTEAELLPVLRSHQQDLGRLDEERSQISAAAFGDATQDRAPARTILSWHQAEPGAEVAPSIERFACAN